MRLSIAMDEDKLPILPSFEGPSCPIPLQHNEQVVMGHGSGGRMTHDLVAQVFQAYLKSPELAAGDDFAAVTLPDSASSCGKLAISTDAHIVFPLFFPGGDIGRLAVCGTVNDIAVSGGVPLFLTASFILEEGLPVEKLHQVLSSMQRAAEEAGITFVAGDTKVVERGKVDGLFISTTGIAWIPEGIAINGSNARPGDIVLVTGTMGNHGMAVIAARGELGLQLQVQSDVAPLNHLISDLLTAAPHTHVLRDPTRGGLATTLNEIARQSQVSIQIIEEAVPVNPAVQAACEMLGFDPLYVANEGKLVAILPEEEAEAALAALRQTQYGQHAAIIGRVFASPSGRVTSRTLIGGTRILDMMAGEMLPRIC